MVCYAACKACSGVLDVVRGKPVACSFGLLIFSYALLYGMAAASKGLWALDSGGVYLAFRRLQGDWKLLEKLVPSIWDDVAFPVGLV